MIQRVLIEDFLKELFEKVSVSFSAECNQCGEEDDIEIYIASMKVDGAAIRFVQDWLQEHKGEL